MAKGPGAPAEGLHSRQYGPQSPWRGKEEARVDRWWGSRKERATARTVCGRAQSTVQGAPLAALRGAVRARSLPRQHPYSGAWLSVESEISQVRNTSAGFR